LVKEASSSASVRFYPLDTKAALISYLVRNPSLSESAVVKNTDTSWTVAFGGKTFGYSGWTGSTGWVSFLGGSVGVGWGSTGAVSFFVGSVGLGSTGVVSLATGVV
jgi:hypothetical protein